MESLTGFGKCAKGFFFSFFWYPTLFDSDFQAANIQSFYVCVCATMNRLSYSANSKHFLCVCVCTLVCAPKFYI